MLDRIGGITARAPLGGQGQRSRYGVLRELPRCSIRSLPMVQNITGLGWCCGFSHSPAITDGLSCNGLAGTIMTERHLIGLAVIIDLDDCAAVGGNSGLRKFPGSLESIISLGFRRCHLSGRAGHGNGLMKRVVCKWVSGEIGVRIVRSVLPPVLHLVSGIALWYPLGRERQISGHSAVGEIPVNGLPVGILIGPLCKGVANFGGGSGKGHFAGIADSLVINGAAAICLKGHGMGRAVKVDFDHQRSIALDLQQLTSGLYWGTLNGGSVMEDQSIPGRCIVAQRYQAVRCSGANPGTVIVPLVFHRVLNIVFHPIGDVRIRFPGGSVSGISCGHGLGGISICIGKDDTAFPAIEQVAAQIHFRLIDGRAVFHITVDNIGQTAVALITISKGQVVLVAAEIELDHRGAVGGNGLIGGGLFGVVGEALRRIRIHRHRSIRCPGKAGAGSQRVRAVQFLQVILHLIGRVVPGGPLGIDRDALVRFGIVRHGGRDGETCTLCRVPARKIVALLGRGCGSRDGGPYRLGKHLDHTAAVGLKGNVAGVGRIAPRDGHGQGDGLRGKGQCTALPDDGHFTGFLHTLAGVNGDDISIRGIGELGVGQFNGEPAFCLVIEVRRRILLLVLRVHAAQVAGLHIHVGHVEQLGRQGEMPDRLVFIGGTFRLRVILLTRRPVECVHILLLTDGIDGPLVFIQGRVISQLFTAEQLRFELDLQIDADLDMQRTGTDALLVTALLPR